MNKTCYWCKYCWHKVDSFSKIYIFTSSKFQAVSTNIYKDKKKLPLIENGHYKYFSNVMCGLSCLLINILTGNGVNIKMNFDYGWYLLEDKLNLYCEKIDTMGIIKPLKCVKGQSEKKSSFDEAINCITLINTNKRNHSTDILLFCLDIPNGENHFVPIGTAETLLSFFVNITICINYPQCLT